MIFLAFITRYIVIFHFCNTKTEIFILVFENYSKRKSCTSTIKNADIPMPQINNESGFRNITVTAYGPLLIGKDYHNIKNVNPEVE